MKHESGFNECLDARCWIDPYAINWLCKMKQTILFVSATTHAHVLAKPNDCWLIHPPASFSN